MNILVVEDELPLSDSIFAYFSQSTYNLTVASNYTDAIRMLEVQDFECVLLDIMLPDNSGLTLIPIIKNLPNSPGILIISARNGLDDKVSGLELGADDYLPKPFYLAELAARIQAILRRKIVPSNATLLIGPMQIDLQQHRLEINGEIIFFTKKEWKLLAFMINNRNRFLSKEAIAEHLLESDIYLNDNFNFVYTHVKNIRRKLIQEGAPDCIKVIYGIGYKFELPAA